VKIIDAHEHLPATPGYLDDLLRTMDECGIERCCISGLGELFDHVDNEGVRQAVAAHPDRLIGQVFVRPGVDGPEVIDWGWREGFKMVKVTIPTVSYDDPSLFPLWERALEHGMSVLFHSGIVAPYAQGRGLGISSWKMQPMQIEPITREFPDLQLADSLPGVPQVVLLLQIEPGLRRRTERFREPERHLRADPRFTVDQFR